MEILRHVSARCEFGEGGQVTPPPIPSPAPPHPPPPSPPLLPTTQHTQPVLQGFQAEIPAKKLKRGHKKKISGRILADFTKNRQKRGRRKFVYCILKIKFITVITAKNKELLLNIFCGPFSACFWYNQPKFGQKFCFLWPLLSFLAGISAW